jgi:hypothetical protein
MLKPEISRSSTTGSRSLMRVFSILLMSATPRASPHMTISSFWDPYYLTYGGMEAVEGCLRAGVKVATARRHHEALEEAAKI